MFPIKHEFSNLTLNAPKGLEDEVLSLPVYVDGSQVISCWKMTWRERFSALFFGKVWLSVSGGTQPPVWLWCIKEAIKKNPDYVKKNLVVPK